MSKDGPGMTMLGNMVEALREGISSNLKKNLDPPEPPDTIMGTMELGSSSGTGYGVTDAQDALVVDMEKELVIGAT